MTVNFEGQKLVVVGGSSGMGRHRRRGGGTSNFDGAGCRGRGEGEPVPRNGTLMERS
jgi:hypothetical protein